MRHLQAASRTALAESRERLESHLDGASEADASRLGDELFAAADLLSSHVVLRRHLGDSSTPAEDRVGLLRSVVGSQLGPDAMTTLEGLVSARWSQPRDIVDAIEVLGRLAILTVAQKQGGVENVEDELFRVGRLVDREPRLRSLLGDRGVGADRRVELLRSVVGGKVDAVTERLLVRAVRASSELGLDRAAEELATLAAERRERFVARVTAPVSLTDEQQQRLATALSRVYGRQIALQVELDESLLGGLVVRVGDEVIDGSIAGRLHDAAQHLPH